MPPIHDWKNLAPDFKDTLLVGNGASIAIDRCFDYKSLLAHATDRGLITPQVEQLFSHFDTRDFELIMRMLWYASHVNKSLGLVEDATRNAYSSLKGALITAVREKHVAFADAEKHLRQIYEFMANFDTVLSLNYDLCVYWAMMAANEAIGGSRFKDCWINGTFDTDWRKFRKPIHTDRTTLVFYPHGSLILGTHPTEGDVKLKLDGSPKLLDRVIEAWATEDYIPLFVSEGTTQQKASSIGRHEYLTTVYNEVMSEVGPTVVVFGWGFGDNDAHILRRLCGSAVKRIAVSVFTLGRSSNELELHCRQVELDVHTVNQRIDVVFFDSAGPGSWNVP